MEGSAFHCIGGARQVAAGSMIGSRFKGSEEAPAALINRGWGQVLAQRLPSVP